VFGANTCSDKLSEHLFLTSNVCSAWMHEQAFAKESSGVRTAAGQGGVAVTPPWFAAPVKTPTDDREKNRQMAACTTAPGIATFGWPATSRRAPLGVIPGGPLSGSRVTPTTYRRRRLAVALLALGVVVVAARAGVALGGSPLAAPERRPASSSAGGASAPSLADGGIVVVRAGDTLWSIASRVEPDADPRPLVDELSAARDGAPLQPGERIRLPD
jgi:hypothetical protein